MQKHIGNALKAHSKAICTVLEHYNAAAQSLNPPRAELTWESVVKYVFLADFNLLADTRKDVCLQPWARPAARALLDQYFKMEHACEEIARLNIEIPRLATYIRDEEDFLLEQESKLRIHQPHLAIQLHHCCCQLINSNDVHLRKFQKLERLPGFTGSTMLGNAVIHMSGRSQPLPPTASTSTMTMVPQSEACVPRDNVLAHDEEGESDEELENEVDDQVWVVVETLVNRPEESEG